MKRPLVPNSPKANCRASVPDAVYLNRRLTETAYNLGKRPGKQTASPTGPGCLIRPYGRVTISRIFPFTGLPSYWRSFGRIDIGMP